MISAHEVAAGMTESVSCARASCERPRLLHMSYCEAHLTETIGAESVAALTQSADRAAKASAKADKWTDRAARFEGSQRRPGDSQKVCPHCGVRGRVTSRSVKQKKGISGGKATGAVLTGGLSILGTGLSRKEKATQMHCHNCNTVWHV